MKRFLVGFFCTFVGLLLVPLVTYPFFAGTQIEAGRFVRESLALKWAIASSLPHPKIIIAGGSNAMFGFSAQQLEAKLHTPAVNLATHAGLGLDYILHSARKAIQPGDVVVLSLEYDLYEGEKNTYAKDFQVLTADQQYLRELPLFQRWAFLIGVSPDHWQQLLKARFRPDPLIKMGYQASDLNNRGDEANNDTRAMTPDQMARIAHLSAIPPIRFRLSNAALRRIVRFGEEAARQKVRVVVVYPNIIENALSEKLNESFFNRLESTLKKHGIEVLGRPRDFAFDKSHALDTMFHQDRIGQRLSTEKLAALLEAWGMVPR